MDADGFASSVATESESAMHMGVRCGLKFAAQEIAKVRPMKAFDTKEIDPLTATT